MGKERFDIDEAFRRLRVATADLTQAAMFDLRDRGFASPFEQLVGSLISARTRDETTLAVSMRLFAVARTPAQMAALDESQITELLRGATFADVKARDIRTLSQRIVTEYQGEVPNTLEGLTAFKGLGLQDCGPDAGGWVWPGGHCRGHPRPPHCKPLGLCFYEQPRADGRGG